MITVTERDRLRSEYKWKLGKLDRRMIELRSELSEAQRGAELYRSLLQTLEDEPQRGPINLPFRSVGGNNG